MPVMNIYERSLCFGSGAELKEGDNKKVALTPFPGNFPRKRRPRAGMMQPLRSVAGCVNEKDSCHSRRAEALTRSGDEREVDQQRSKIEGLERPWVSGREEKKKRRPSARLLMYCCMDLWTNSPSRRKFFKQSFSRVGGMGGRTRPPGAAPGDFMGSYHLGSRLERFAVLLAVGSGDDGDETVTGPKAPKRKTVGLTLRLTKVSAGLESSALHEGAALPACEAIFGEGSALVPGMLLETLVVTVTTNKTVIVTTDPAKSNTVLGDGLLVSFLTYFHGTVDPFHLMDPLSGNKWKVFDGTAIVKRVDPGLGLLLELPITEDASCAGYVHVSNVSDERTEKPLDKMFKVDEKVTTRVIGFRLVDGLATVSMKKSVVEQQVVSYKDMHPGQPLSCVVHSIEAYGIIVTVVGGSGTIKALVPLLHASDTGTDKALTKFKVGQKVTGHVLDVDPVNRRMTLTLKKGLMGSKLPILASMQQAVPGIRVHGVVTGAKSYGVFVSFYGGVLGLARAADIGLEHGKKPDAVYMPGQVVKARVEAVEPATGRLRISINSKEGARAQAQAADQPATPVVDVYGGIQEQAADHPPTPVVDVYGGTQVSMHDFCVVPCTAEEQAADHPPTPVVDVYGGTQVSMHAFCVVPCTAEEQAADHPPTPVVDVYGGTQAADQPATPVVDVYGGTQAADQPATPVVDVYGGIQAADQPATPVADVYGGIQVGDVVTGTIKQRHTEEDSDGNDTITSFYVDVDSDSVSQIPARLEVAHLADHPAAVDALKKALVPGCETGPMVVMERFGGGSPHLKVSRKHSLVQAAASLPKVFEDVKTTAILPAYVSGVTGDAVFVRYLGHVSGRAGLAQLADAFVSDPHQYFTIGQSVCSQVTQVDVEKRRFGVTLKPTLTASSDASFLQALLRDLEFAAELEKGTDSALLRDLEFAAELEKGTDSESAAAKWDKDLKVGSLVSGSVHGVESYGAICDLDPHPDLVGIIRPHQEESEVAVVVGAPVTGRVLDVSKQEGIVDLSLKAEMVKAGEVKGSALKELIASDLNVVHQHCYVLHASQCFYMQPTYFPTLMKSSVLKKLIAKDLKVGAKVEAVVEMVKESYLVLSLPEQGGVLAFAATTDYNTQNVEHVLRKFSIGQKLEGTVQVHPNASSGGRMLLAVSLTKASETLTKKGSETPQEKPSRALGGIVTGTVTALHPHHVDVKFGKTFGRIHVTEVVDLTEGALPQASPLDAFAVQQQVECVVLGRLGGGGPWGARHGVVDLSVRPSILKAAHSKADVMALAARVVSKLKPGKKVLGIIQEIGEDHIWIMISPQLRGRVYLYDISDDPDQLAHFQDSFKVGQAVAARLMSVSSSGWSLGGFGDTLTKLFFIVK
eukprot:gene495-1901_t